MSETRDFPLLASWDLIKELQARIVELETENERLTVWMQMAPHSVGCARNNPFMVGGVVCSTAPNPYTQPREVTPDCDCWKKAALEKGK
jgi:hypothetical protein